MPEGWGRTGGGFGRNRGTPSWPRPRLPLGVPWSGTQWSCFYLGEAPSTARLFGACLP